MQLYECTVRLGGSMHNEVLKQDVSAAEIIVLQAIHAGAETGVPVVHKIKPTRITNRTDLDERKRIEDIYGVGLANVKSGVEKLFGHHMTPLPDRVAGVDPAPPTTGRRAKVKPAEPELDLGDDEEIGEKEFA